MSETGNYSKIFTLRYEVKKEGITRKDSHKDTKEEKITKEEGRGCMLSGLDNFTIR
jgi:DNA polymerase II small subunit/DNA polymerase delta subunit B